MDQSIIPECYVDTNLVETLVPPQKQYNHQHRCGTVTKVMKGQFADRFALGIIDRDKNEVDYLKEFSEVCINGSLILHKHKVRHHYIIQISPAIERFIIANANKVGLLLGDFSLPSDFEQLKKVSKTTNSKNDIRFKRLFKALHQDGAEDIQRLAFWIKYLKENNYNVDIDKLKEL
jgi:hypothetical protein